MYIFFLTPTITVYDKTMRDDTLKHPWLIHLASFCKSSSQPFLIRP